MTPLSSVKTLARRLVTLAGRAVIAILDAVAEYALSRGLRRTTILGVRVLAKKEDIAEIQSQMEIVQKLRPSALARLSLTAGFVGWSQSFVDLRRNRGYLRIDDVGKGAADIVAVSRALQLFRLVDNEATNLRRIADIVVDDMLLLSRRAVRVRAKHWEEYQKLLWREEHLRRVFMAEFWDASLGWRRK